tara:strand:+ start:647 stop:1366 length:720 start_codon:yes stop_codon:yes gene_type:complete
MLNIAIVEDELPALEKLKAQLSRVCAHALLFTYQSVKACLASSELSKVDVLFVDINLPDASGVSLVKSLKQLGFKGECVFSTAYSEFAVEPFTIGAADYLLKPYTDERLSLALSRVNDKLNNKTSEFQETEEYSLVSKVGVKVTLVKVSDICAIKLEHGQAIAYGSEVSYLLDHSLDELMTLLPFQFLRVHRNGIVNIKEIKQMDRWVTGGYLIKFHQSEVEVISSRDGGRLLKDKLMR